MIGHSTPIADWLVIFPVLACLIGAGVLLVLRRFLALQGPAALLVLLAVVAGNAALYVRVRYDGPVAMTMGRWLPPFGITFAADIVGSGLALLASATTLLIAIAMWANAPQRAVRDGLFPLVLLVLAGVNGSFLTGDLFNLYVWFEVMLISSFGLMVIGGAPVQLEATVKYGLLNVLATTLFLLALGVFYGLVGTLNMADIVTAAKHVDQAPLAAIAALFTLSFGMKAAVFPANAWLPAAYHTPPATVSALMGALLTKVGLYAMLRLLIMLLPDARVQLAPELQIIAWATMVAGPLMAFGESGLRRATGFLLIGGMGLAMGGIANGTPPAVEATVFYLAHSMMSMAAMYLIAGEVEKAGGGLWSNDLGLALALLAVCLAVAGMPPFLGFWPKVMLLRAATESGDWLLLSGVLANGLFSLLAAGRLFTQHAWRGAKILSASGRGYRVPMLAITATVVVAGLVPSVLLDAAKSGVADLFDPTGMIAAVGLAP